MTIAGPLALHGEKKKAKMTETQLASAVVLGLHRLVKQSTLYTTENDAQRRQLEQTQRAIAGFGNRTGKNPKIFFTDKSVFVGGKLLRAGRNVYDAALELGRLLERLDVDEVTFGYDVSLDELRLLQRHVAEAIRGAGPSPRERRYERIRLHRGVPPLQRSDRTRLAPEEQVMRGYATAIVVMRRFLERVQAGEHEMPNRVRRLAEQLADLVAIDSPVFLASIAIYNSRHEHAGRAVNAALLAIGIARQITDSKSLLSRIAMAALLFDVGIPRVAGSGPLGDARVGLSLPKLAEEQLAELPAATAGVITALGGLSAASKTVAVLVFEAMHIIHHAEVRPLYDGRQPPTLEARIVAAARQFTALVADPDHELTAGEAIERMWRRTEEEGQRTAIRLLMGALALYPPGSLVELDDGTIAQVTRISTDPAAFAFPTVRAVVDASGGTAAGSPIDLSLDRSASIIRFVGMGDPPLAEHPPEADHRASYDDEEHEEPAVGRVSDVGLEEAIAAERAATASATSAQPETSHQDDHEDDDDVPSMVLQAIIDGRREQDQDATSIFQSEHPKLAAGDSAGSENEDDAVATPRRASSLPASAPPSPTDASPSPPPASSGTEAPNISSTPRGDAPKRRSSFSARIFDELCSEPPTARGTFAKTPLVHLLIYALDHSLTGTMIFRAEGRDHFLFLDDGVPAKARTDGTVAPLDQVLEELALLDEATLQQSLRTISRTRELHGRHLVAAGKLEVSQVMAALAWQLARKVAFMLRLPDETEYAFYADRNLLENHGGRELTPVEPLTLVMTGVRILSDRPLIERTLSRLGSTPLRLRREAALEKLSLKDQEARVTELLRVRPLELSELLERELAHPRVVQHTIYALLITRSLRIGEQMKPPVGAGRAPIPFALPSRQPGGQAESRSGTRRPLRPSGTSRSVSPELGEGALPRRGGARPKPSSPGHASDQGSAPSPRRDPPTPAPASPIPRRQTSSAETLSSQPRSHRKDPSHAQMSSTGSPAPPQAHDDAARASAPGLDRPQIKAWVEGIGQKNFYEILGVPEDATTAQIQTAYFQLAKSWHPDRLPEELEDLEPQVARVFSKVNEAFQTLTNPQKRAHYQDLLASGGGTALDREILERAVDSAMLFQKAEVLFRKGALGKSQELVEKAVEADPDQPEYRTLLAWIKAERAGLPEGNPRHYDEQIEILDAVLEHEPEFERARFFRATLLKRLGRMDEAIKDFRIVAKQNRRNIDAAREVRLYQMRHRDEGGLLGRLFKKK